MAPAPKPWCWCWFYFLPIFKDLRIPSWVGNEIAAKILALRECTARISRDFNEEYPKLRSVVVVRMRRVEKFIYRVYGTVISFNEVRYRYLYPK